MDGFNFYINVDECLNMSNFEMFFYQLQYAHKFYVVNATFHDDAVGSDELTGVKSIQDAAYGISSFIGQSSFLIQDYRLVFSIRQPYKKEVVWKESVLYRLLKIFYSLQNARLFIKTKDHADKNVTVILLYDVNNTMDEKDIGDMIEDHTRDIPLLMDYLKIDWQDRDQYPEERDIASAMTRSENLDLDPVTKRFVLDYYDWFTGHNLDEPEKENSTGMDIELIPKGVKLPEAQRREAEVYNRVNNLTTYITSQIGQYCVFTKSISSNTGDHRLALLGVVDYITTGLVDSDDEDEQYTNATLKQKARDNWASAKDDRTVWEKYGAMMRRYERRMQDRLISLEGRIASGSKHLTMEYENPPRISRAFDSAGYEKRIAGILKDYRNSIRFSGSDISWKETQRKLEDLVGELSLSLETYSDKLSDAYREEMKRRTDAKKTRLQDNEIYNRDQIDDQLRNLRRKKQDLLDGLKKQKMTPRVGYQDQLNVNSSIKSCSRKMEYYLQRLSRISLRSFLVLLFAGGGFVLLSHLLLQESLLGDMVNVFGFAASAAVGAVIMIAAWGAPGLYYRRKIAQALKLLEEELVRYTHGYSELAENFEEYMNIINTLDVMNDYIQELERLRILANEDSRMLLWHKEAIERHLSKCSFFHLLYEGVLQDHGAAAEEIPLDLKKDVVNNRFYWPQESNGG